MSKKKIALIVVAVVVVLVAVVLAVVLTKEPVIEGTLTEIMEKVYAGIPDDEKPMMLMSVEITDELEEGFFGTTELTYKEALASEPAIGSIAHSVMLIRFETAKEAKAAVEKLKTSVNPRKWICVEAKNVVVERKGDLVIVIMADSEGQTTPEIAPKLTANFGGLK